jgi:DNA mismatch repair protein MutL
MLLELKFLFNYIPNLYILEPMPIISTLPENLINQIAAGEVVERPASCIKELIENSIDAEAGKIVLEVESGGKTYIKISDDGFGMDKKDAKLCFERHATSKIKTQEDLSHINSMGFRGEALASIASVSVVTLKTKKRGDFVGTLTYLEGGRLLKNENCATSEGTQIEIKNLFFNTPARQKYLKADTTEFQHILSVVQGFALSHPQISFKLIHDGKVILDLPGGHSPLDRIRYVLGRDTAENVVPVFTGSVSIKIEGYVGKPNIARGSRDRQHLFINHREVQNNALSFAIKDCFRTLISDGKYPLFVINIEMDPTQVDVNVHPRKSEVRFVNQREMFKKVQETVKASLQKHMLTPQMSSRDFAPPSAGDTQDAMQFTENFAAPQGQDRPHQPLEDSVEGISMFPIAQIANSYIITQNEEGLNLIDQHAAHERIMYERLTTEYQEKSSVGSQPLLLPTSLELDHKDLELLKSNMEVFETLGFELEEFSGNTVSVNAVPSALSNREDLATAILGLLDDIRNSIKPSTLQGRIEQTLTFIACRSAIKFGQKLSFEEQIQLIKDLEKLERRYTCPHGRPTMIQLTFNELEKRFGRK